MLRLFQRPVSSFSNKVEVWHNFRVVARAASGSTASIDTRLLGVGQINLFAVGITPDGRSIKSKPLTIEVFE